MTTEYDSGRARRLLLGAERPTWQVHAACRGVGTRAFFQERYDTTDRGKAKAICAECPVVMECADFGSHFGERHGIWGGMNPIELRKWRRMRGGKAVCFQCEQVFKHPVALGTSVRYCSAECSRRAATDLQTAARRRRKVSA